MKRIRVLLRVWLRSAVRWLTGRRFTVPLPDARRVRETTFRSFLKAVIENAGTRQVGNRDLLTGMVVALIAGPNVVPWSGWEQYKNAPARRSNFRRGVPYRFIGKPAVYKTSKGVKIGLTDWLDTYVSRDEVLAPRRARRAARLAAA